MNITELFNNVPAVLLLALLLPSIGRVLKASPIPDWLIPVVMAAVGGAALLVLPATEIGLGDASPSYRVMLGAVAGFASVGVNQSWKQASKRLVDGPEEALRATSRTTPCSSQDTMKKLTLPIIVAACAGLSGCARFSTTQTDYSYENGQQTRKITTKASAITCLAGKSALEKWKASQTDKTQSASVGTMSQEVDGTNTVAIIDAVITAAVKAAAAIAAAK